MLFRGKGTFLFINKIGNFFHNSVSFLGSASKTIQQKVSAATRWLTTPNSPYINPETGVFHPIPAKVTKKSNSWRKILTSMLDQKGSLINHTGVKEILKISQ